jgi:hypothetical protein
MMSDDGAHSFRRVPLPRHVGEPSNDSLALTEALGVAHRP